MIQPHRLRPKRRLLRAQLAAQRAVDRDMALGAAAARAAIGNPIANASPHYQQHYARQYSNPPGPYAIPGYPTPLPSLIGMGQTAPPPGWLPATFFDTRPHGITRRWYRLVRRMPSSTNAYGYYEAILFTKGGGQQRPVIALVRRAGPGRVEARYYADPAPSVPYGTSWQHAPYAIPSQNPGPYAIPGYPAPLPTPVGMGQEAPPTGWQTATFFDTRPGIARRWYQLLKPGTGGLPIPGYWPIPGTPSTPQQFYTAILFTKNGAEQRYVIVETRPAGQGKVQAKFYREVPGGWDPSSVPTWPPPGWPAPPGHPGPFPGPG